MSAEKQIPPGYKMTEVGVIPEEWEYQIVDRITTVVASGHSHVNSEFGDYPVYGSTGIIGRSTFSDYSGKAVLIARVGANAGKIAVVDGHYCVTDNTIIVKSANSICMDFFWRQLEAKRLNSLVFGSGQPLITGTQVKKLYIPIPPTLAEQEAIAAALSDADGLIEALEALIAKKRAIKQGAMQELLTGKRRLPGFEGKWEEKRLGEALTIMHGKSQHDVEDENGIYPILASGGQIGTSNQFLFNKPSVLIGRKGTIDQPQYMDAPFWSVDTLFYSIINEPNNPKFIFYRFFLINWRLLNEGSGVPSLNARTIENIEISLPESLEQAAIAAVLSDMDAEIEALEDKLAKARRVKVGMMQELLTGRIRLNHDSHD